jgi:hypothetical protein
MVDDSTIIFWESVYKIACRQFDVPISYVPLFGVMYLMQFSDESDKGRVDICEELHQISSDATFFSRVVTGD